MPYEITLCTQLYIKKGKKYAKKIKFWDREIRQKIQLHNKKLTKE